MKLSLRDIATEEFMREIQDSFAIATGFGVVFVDSEGYMISEGSNFCEFCTALNETEAGSCSCANFNKEVINIDLDQPHRIFICHAGLINIEIPIIYEGQLLGALTAGNVRCTDETDYPSSFDEEALIRNHSDLMPLYDKVTKMSRTQIEGTAKALENLTNYFVQHHIMEQIQLEIAEQKRIQAELQMSLNKAKLEALEKQTTPHFTFNVLNSISRLISMKEYSTAQEMLFAFSKMLRYTCQSSSSIVCLRDELAYIENYIKIQKIRFNEHLIYRSDVDPSLLDVRLPFFVLQPIVENAVIHSLLKKSTPGVLEVKCARGRKINGSKSSVEIIIEDNGIGMSEDKILEVTERMKETVPSGGTDHTGLNNCYQRLRLVFGDDLKFSIEPNEPSGTRIIISFPEVHEHESMT